MLKGELKHYGKTKPKLFKIKKEIKISKIPFLWCISHAYHWSCFSTYKHLNMRKHVLLTLQTKPISRHEGTCFIYKIYRYHFICLCYTTQRCLSIDHKYISFHSNTPINKTKTEQTTIASHLSCVWHMTTQEFWLEKPDFCYPTASI